MYIILFGHRTPPRSLSSRVSEPGGDSIPSRFFRSLGTRLACTASATDLKVYRWLEIGFLASLNFRCSPLLKSIGCFNELLDSIKLYDMCVCMCIHNIFYLFYDYVMHKIYTYLLQRLRTWTTHYRLFIVVQYKHTLTRSTHIIQTLARSGEASTVNGRRSARNLKPNVFESVYIAHATYGDRTSCSRTQVSPPRTCACTTLSSARARRQMSYYYSF